MKKAILAVVTLCFCAASFAASTITTRPEDPKAIYLDVSATIADNYAALQAAIDKASDIRRKLEDSFFSIRGAAVNAAGNLYFVDHHNQRIYRWNCRVRCFPAGRLNGRNRFCHRTR